MDVTGHGVNSNTWTVTQGCQQASNNCKIFKNPLYLGQMKKRQEKEGRTVARTISIGCQN